MLYHAHKILPRFECITDRIYLAALSWGAVYYAVNKVVLDETRKCDPSN